MMNTHLNPKIIKDLIDLLSPFVTSELDRRSLVVQALGSQSSLLQRIDWTGNTAGFVVELVTCLSEYGEIESGKSALWVVLETVREQVGLDRQRRIDQLRDVINSIDISTTKTSLDVNRKSNIDFHLYIKHIEHLAHLSDKPTTLNQCRQIGKSLFYSTFDDEIRDQFEAIRHKARAEGIGINLVLHNQESPALPNIPWELLHDGTDFIILQNDISFIYARDTSADFIPVESPLRILFTAVSPDHYPPIEFRKEAAILHELGNTHQEIEVVRVQNCTASQLRKYFQDSNARREPFHIWHHRGHIDQVNDGVALVFASSTISIENAAKLAAKYAELCLVVIDAETMLPGSMKTLAVFQSPMIIGFRYPIVSSMREIFLTVLYGHLSDQSIAKSVAQARREMRRLDPNGISWTTPYLFSSVWNKPLLSAPQPLLHSSEAEPSVSNVSTSLDSVLIVTVTKVEVQAVLEVFSQAAGTAWTRQAVGNKMYYYLGIHGGAPVFMVQSEMGIAGPGGALLTVNQAIRDLHPQAIIMCGIAFGLRPDKQKLGDILISRQLHYYEPQKIDVNRGQMPRGDRTTSSERLLSRFRSGDIDWQGAQTHFGLVLSGEKLVNDPAFRDWLLKTEPEAIGGEMEGAGLYAAARDVKADWILVKAVCDWADGDKNDHAQPLAAHNAAQFVLHVLQLGGWDNSEESPLVRR